MFRYISLGTSARVPRDLISDTLRMVSCHHKTTAASEPDGKWGGARGVAELISFSAFVSISLPLFDIFYFGSQGWMGSRCGKTRFLNIFPK